MKISLFVHNLTSNTIVRAFPISQALKRLGVEIEILGFLYGTDIYEPYQGLFDYRAISITNSIPQVLANSYSLSQMASGDIIYAFKPLWTSYWPALLASGFGRRKPLLLDIEDDELRFQFGGIGSFILAQVLRSWRSATALKYNLALHPLTYLCKHKTVVSSRLQSRYGGQILLHGPDEEVFNPDRSELVQKRCRRVFDLPKDAPLLLFAGFPYPYKGLQTLVESLQQPEVASFQLVLAGPEESEGFRMAASSLGNRCHILGFLPNRRMPEILSAVDVIPIPQNSNSITEAQIPAKLLEAMAMSKTIVASDVSDLARILGEGEQKKRGWIIPPGDAGALTGALADILHNPKEAKRRGEAAREYFLQGASINAMSKTLSAVLNEIV